MKRAVLVILVFILQFSVAQAQSVFGSNTVKASAEEIVTIPKSDSETGDFEQITEVLNHYIEGTVSGQQQRLRKAFHPDFNLYTVTNDTLWVRSGKQYIADVKEGQKTNRIGRIVSIDIENNAAMAKVEIAIPNWRIFTDYFLLLKYQGSWKIVQKSYSSRPIPSSEKK